jgi:exodeoxyribonuclease VII small subunit
MTRKKDNEQGPRFEAILADLETVVTTLEQGDLPLEEALEAFERGVKLTREGERILGDAEKKVEILLKGEDGEPVLQPLESATETTTP